MSVRMLAPAATVAWKLSANFYEAIVRVGGDASPAGYRAPLFALAIRR
jgi:hypothetical protein